MKAWISATLLLAYLVSPAAAARPETGVQPGVDQPKHSEAPALRLQYPTIRLDAPGQQTGSAQGDARDHGRRGAGTPHDRKTAPGQADLAPPPAIRRLNL